MHAIAYTRLSRETEKSGSHETQAAAIAEWCRSNGYQLTASYRDSSSGGLPLERRPVLLTALAHAERIGAALVVYRRDRLARNALSAALVESRIQVLSVCEGANQTPEEQLLCGILDTVSAFERARVSQRCVDSAALRKRQGKQVGRKVGAKDKAPRTRRPLVDERTVLASRLLREGISVKKAAKISGLSWGKTNSLKAVI